MLEKKLQTRKEIVDQAAFVFAKIFGQIEKPVGVKAMLEFMYDSLGDTVVNAINLDISEPSYKSHIEWLINKGTLNNYIKDIIDHNYRGYKTLGEDEKDEVVQAQKKILSLTSILRSIDKPEKKVEDLNGDEILIPVDSPPFHTLLPPIPPIPSSDPNPPDKLTSKQMLGGAGALIGSVILGFLLNQVDTKYKKPKKDESDGIL